MSEDLTQMPPKKLGRYLYYSLGNTTIAQLRKNKIIKGKYPKSIEKNKPDGLIVLSDGQVKAVVEVKQPSKLKTKAQITTAIDQEINVAKHLCKLLIVTSCEKSFWLNAFNREHILTEDGKKLKLIFDTSKILNNSMSNEDIDKLEKLIDQIDNSLTEKNSALSPPKTLDPSQLARSIWQKIWVQTGKEPEKCLYNVVELFLFKFLSDVGVLTDSDTNNFRWLYEQYENDNPKKTLKHYATSCRKDIEELFPKGEDNTTIINGTIFVNERGTANQAQADLFCEILKALKEYENEYGSFRQIEKEFKTRLYETFLRQSAGVKALGQYFTPRNVVIAMVEMSNASELKKGDRVCDPFCGVGGFILELIARNKHIMKEFEPKNGKIRPQITLIGYDKGSDEKDDERTIILAKANMLIYFSDLLAKYNTKEHIKELSKNVLNKVFYLLRSNLGTFEKIERKPFDLILTNPPYVTAGTSILKRKTESGEMSKIYTAGGKGTESMALQWIVSHLKENGQAFVVVPAGLLKQNVMLQYLKDNCLIQAVVSLPSKTFYSTPQKTYILGLRKKTGEKDEQADPVFTYFVSEIGETRDAKRWPNKQNDLNEMASLFNQFKGAPHSFKTSSKRCKIINFKNFDKKPHWMVDYWWTRKQKKALGIDFFHYEVTEKEFIDLLSEAQESIGETLKGLCYAK